LAVALALSELVGGAAKDKRQTAEQAAAVVRKVVEENELQRT
jgi:hypothetical protein